MVTRAKKHVLVLRTCNEKLQSYGGFQWPAKGPVEAPDWMPTTDCGDGLHGFLWGEGEGQLADWTETAKWLVVRVVAADVIDLGGKVKFPRGEVVFCGERTAATAYIAAHGAVGKSIVGGTSTSGDGGTIIIAQWDGAANRYRYHVAYPGENGIEPNVPYVLNERGEFVKKEAE